MKTIENQFLAEIEDLHLDNQSALDQRKIEAIEFFKNLGLPTIKNEDWKYSNLKNVSNSTYNFEVKSHQSSFNSNFYDENGLNIYIINGHLQSFEFEPIKGLKIYSKIEALIQIPELMNEHYGNYANVENEAVTALNSAISKHGIVVVIDKNTTLEKPILIHSLIEDNEEAIGVLVHNLVIAGENSEAIIIESFESKNQKDSFSNYLTEILVEKSARLDYYKLQNETDSSTHVGTTQICQKTQSVFYAATITINGGFVRNNLNLVLDGENIESHMFGLYLPNKKQHIDNHTLVDHQKPNCESNELYKGILLDNSTGVFNGKIFVREDAQKTNAYQNCRNVIASDNATMNTKPQLEIWADDVKCSHGTTTGKLNDEAIFYMQSRGIPKEEAIRMQMFAFAADVVSNIKITAIREKVETLIQEKLV